MSKTLLLRNLPEKTIRRLHAVAALFDLRINDYATQLIERGMKEDFRKLHDQHHEELSQEEDG